MSQICQLVGICVVEDRTPASNRLRFSVSGGTRATRWHSRAQLRSPRSMRWYVAQDRPSS